MSYSPHLGEGIVIDFLQIILFTAHIVCVSIGGVGPLFCLWFDWRSRTTVRLAHERQGESSAAETAWAHCLARRQAVWSVVMLLCGAALGGVQLGLIWLAGNWDYFETWSRIATERLKYAGIEWIFSIVCMLLYLLVQRGRPRLGSFRGMLAVLLPLLAATNTLYHFPVLFAVVTVLGFEGGEPTSIKFTDYLVRQAVLVRAGHFIGAAVVITSVEVMWLCLKARCGAVDRDATIAVAIQRVGWLALAAIVGEIVLGVGLLTVLPAAAQRSLLGGNPLATGVFGAAVVVVVVAMHYLGMISLGNCEQRQIARLSSFLLLAVLLMSTARHMSHAAAVPHHVRDAPVQTHEHVNRPSAADCALRSYCWPYA
ncbi:MAG: hypothetical protein R3C10_13460 [Pirellulales bacterium]